MLRETIRMISCRMFLSPTESGCSRWSSRALSRKFLIWTSRFNRQLIRSEKSARKSEYHLANGSSMVLLVISEETAD